MSEKQFFTDAEARAYWLRHYAPGWESTPEYAHYSRRAPARLEDGTFTSLKNARRLKRKREDDDKQRLAAYKAEFLAKVARAEAAREAARRAEHRRVVDLAKELPAKRAADSKRKRQESVAAARAARRAKQHDSPPGTAGPGKKRPAGLAGAGAC